MFNNYLELNQRNITKTLNQKTNVT